MTAGCFAFSNVLDTILLMMTADEFSAFVTKSRTNLETIQADFSARISNSERWYYDLVVCTVYFDGEAMPMTPIGTFNSKHQSFMWTWANNGFPPLAREKSKQLQALYSVTGFQIFQSEAIKATGEECMNLVAVAVHHLKGIGFFRAPSKDPEEPSMFFSMDQPNSEERRS